MMIRVRFTGRSVMITGVGLAGVALAVILLPGILGLPRLLSAPFEPEDARKEVRHFLERQVYQNGMEEMKARGLSVPSIAMAQRWQEEIAAVRQLDIVSVEVKRPLLLLLSIRPSYVVRVIFHTPTQQHHTRYFVTVRRMVSREASRLAWILAL